MSKDFFVDSMMNSLMKKCKSQPESPGKKDEGYVGSISPLGREARGFYVALAPPSLAKDAGASD
jgi:hypothetical protein